MGSAQKEIRAIVKAAEEQGWRVKQGKAHYLLLAPDGINKVTVASTPSDHRALDNAISRLRRYGLKWKGR